jgi:adenylosuccinate lyase
MSTNHALLSISPIDGRYAATTSVLQGYFSEYALIKYRLHVEVEYLSFLNAKKVISIPTPLLNVLKKAVKNFNETEALKIKAIEKTTNHDVKAVEYYLKNILNENGGEIYQEWIHFGLTSQDINNTAIPLSIKEATNNIILPTIQALIDAINELAISQKNTPMLARTHGQAATPTTLGKELKVFSYRLENQLVQLEAIPFMAKFGGATGAFNAHKISFPNVNWPKFANDFINKKLQLHRLQFTTQIDNYDNIAAWCDALKRINTIFIDFSRDVWQYISVDYFGQKVIKGEVGSSAMPHKVNPIDFENAEGNLGIANALLEHFAAKLPISRLQRDLTDSTVLRNIGVPVAHIYVAMKALQRGINKLVVNKHTLNADLENNWAVVAEAMQTILRKEGVVGAYELLKNATRGGEKITQKTMISFVNKLKVSDALKKKLLKITPQNYIGFASDF